MRLKRLFLYIIKKNKRQFKRLNIHHLLRYKVVEKREEISYISFVRNISAGGLLFYSKEYIPKDSIVELEISFPPYSKIVSLKAQVLRTEFLNSVGGFNIAVKFIDPEKEVIDFINDKILKVYKKIENKKEEKMRLLAFIFVIIAGLFGIFGIVAKILRLHLPIALVNWMDIVKILLLFSISMSLLVISKKIKDKIE